MPHARCCQEFVSIVAGGPHDGTRRVVLRRQISWRAFIRPTCLLVSLVRAMIPKLVGRGRLFPGAGVELKPISKESN